MCSNITTKFNIELSQLLIENISNKFTFDQLLFNGANINAQNEKGWCVLFEFIHLQKSELIEEYLDKGLNIHIRDTKGRNALFWAIYSGNIAAAKLLITLGIDTIIARNEQLGMMQYIIYKDDLLLFSELINMGMSVNEKDLTYTVPLIYAVLYSKVNFIDYLITKGADKFLVDSLGNCAYTLAQELKDECVIKRLE